MESEKHFGLKFAGRQVLLRVLPPEGGKKANLSDIQRELRQRDVPYRHETLFDIYRRASGEFEPLAIQESRQYQIEVEVSKDGQQAWMTVIPPDMGEEKLTPEQVRKALGDARVEKGILYDQIKRILAQPGTHERVLIARGKPRKNGQDGTIQFVEKSTESAISEENRVDYRELNLINNVAEGDLIARITPPVPGEDGYTVRAQILKALPGRKAKYVVGRNVRLSEDGRQIFAEKDGFVVRSGDKISVENILQVDNVDAASGNIRFQGVVRVKGQVEDAFVVEAEKGIEVGGTVGHARLRSKGDIRVKGGAIGADLECEGNLQARFLSESKVRAGGSVVIDEYILHCEVVAKQSVKITRDTKGFIQGGRIRAGTEIWSPVVGSQMSEGHTALEVGSGVSVRKRFDALQQRIVANIEQFQKMRLNLAYLQRQREAEGPTQGKQRETFEHLVRNSRRLGQELIQQARLHHELLPDLAQPEPETGYVFISNVANSGTTVQIQAARVSLTSPLESCAFTYLGSSLKTMPYGAALKLHKQQKAKRRSEQAPPLAR